MRSFNIEAIFGGILALVVLGVAFFAIADTTFTPRLPGGNTGAGVGAPGSSAVSTTSSAPAFSAASGQDLVCECYDKAFDLAGRARVLSPEYRTGFEQCRARGGVDGGDAWTAGWNARLSSRPYEASCRAYKRRL